MGNKLGLTVPLKKTEGLYSFQMNKKKISLNLYKLFRKVEPDNISHFSPWDSSAAGEATKFHKSVHFEPEIVSHSWPCVFSAAGDKATKNTYSFSYWAKVLVLVKSVTSHS